MKILKRIKEKSILLWKKLNGNKTTVGTVIWLTSLGLQAFFPDLLTLEQYKFIEYTGMSISGMGLVHKGTKEIIKNKDKLKINFKK